MFFLLQEDFSSLIFPPGSGLGGARLCEAPSERFPCPPPRIVRRAIWSAAPTILPYSRGSLNRPFSPSVFLLRPPRSFSLVFLNPGDLPYGGPPMRTRTRVNPPSTGFVGWPFLTVFSGMKASH